jgi:hypothetical protein
MYSCTLSLTSALDWGGWSTPRPGRFTPGKETRYPSYRRLSGPQGRSGRLQKISPPTGIRSPDRPTRSESLYRLSHAGPLPQQCDPTYVNWQRAGDAVGRSGRGRMVMVQWAGVETGRRQSSARGSLLAVHRPLLHRQYHLRRRCTQTRVTLTL